ncbi:Hypothetical protein PHPALM_21197 [Phytophthora palmivora]|uniref:carbonic anhydrase n=1 Tax=Phytophthora palmivora TaxID=4796 RepID=A0A2P4XCZ2_9STRA|nr:Hypothetical protein PHPALM_21197 [Phytophthora palmivora]
MQLKYRHLRKHLALSHILHRLALVSDSGLPSDEWSHRPISPVLLVVQLLPLLLKSRHPQCQRREIIEVRKRQHHSENSKHQKLSDIRIDKQEYAGSLTTPACSEIVDWWVVKKPVDVSTADLERLQSQLRELHITDDGKNARPVQPLNGRVVTALL